MLISCLDWLQWETINSFQKFSWNFSYICQYKWNKCSKCSRILPLSAEWCTPPHTHTHTHTHTLIFIKKEKFRQFQIFWSFFPLFLYQNYLFFLFHKRNYCNTMYIFYYIIILYILLYYFIIFYYIIIILLKLFYYYMSSLW